MSTSWIIEVLSDVQTFAKMNGLQRLADELDRTLEVAMDEISNLDEAVERRKVARRH